MPVKKEVFACEFCDRIYRHKSSAVAHEKKCYGNPELRACRSCGYSEKSIDDNGMEGDYYREWKFWWCNFLDKELVTPEKPAEAMDIERETHLRVGCSHWIRKDNQKGGEG